MTGIKIGLVCALVLGPCAAMYALGGRPAAKTLPLSICALGLILYTFGLFLPFSCCTAIVWVICALCWAIFLLRAGSIRSMARFFSVPVLLFLAGAPVLYYACCNRLYISYDEHSHWGLIVKLIAAFDALPRAGGGAQLLLFNYPPAGAMLPSLCASLFGYREGVVYFGYALSLWGLMLGLVPPRAKAPGQLAAAALGFVCMMTVFPFAILRLFSEPLIALLFALIVAYASEEETARFNGVRMTVLVCFLALTKNSAPLFVALCLLACFCMRPDRRTLASCARLALCGAAAFFSYLIYCRIQGIFPAFESHWLENIRALFAGNLDARYAGVPGRFAVYFFTHPLSQAGVYSTYGPGTSAAVLYGALMALCGVHTALARDRATVGRTYIGIWAGNAVYVMFIMASYVFFFNPSEAQRLNELDRYLSLPALWTALTLCALLSRDACAAPTHARVAFFGAVTLACVPLCHPQLAVDTLLTRKTVENTLWAREDTARTAAFLRGELDFSQKRTIRILGTCDYMALRYEMILEADFGHPNRNWNEGEFVGSVEGVHAEIEQGGYAYVYIAAMQGNVPERDVDARYASLFEGGEAAMRAHSLYEVKKEPDGAVRLVYKATRADAGEE